MTWNPLWDDVFSSRRWGQYPGEDVVRFVARNFYDVPDRSAVRLLEVGSGTGANLWFMAREGFCVHGIEGATAGVRIACRRLDLECAGWRERGGRVEAGDFGRLDYPDAYFDGVLDVVAVCYSNWEAARGTYAELARVTQPGGRLFVRTFAQGCWGEGTGEAAGRQMWVCDEGPLKDLGATRFTSVEDVPDLLPGWRVDAIGRSASADHGDGPELRHLLIQATRV
jgi:SAM-dependent methyltransferase